MLTLPRWKTLTCGKKERIKTKQSDICICFDMHGKQAGLMNEQVGRPRNRYGMT